MAKLCANWVTGELSGALNKAGLDIGESPVTPKLLAYLLSLIADNFILADGAKKVFEEIWQNPTHERAAVKIRLPTFSLSATGTAAEVEAANEDTSIIDDIIEAKGLKQITRYRGHRSHRRQSNSRQSRPRRAIPLRQRQGADGFGRSNH